MTTPPNATSDPAAAPMPARSPSGVLAPRAGTENIRGLDGVRAIAVLIVVIAHAGFGHLIPGGFGVTIFFFISGFLITRLLLAETVSEGRVHLGRFYARRFIRLLPALLVMLALTWIMMLMLGRAPFAREVITSLTYTGNFLYGWHMFTGAPRSAPWEHLWSLAIEEHFYLLFPILVVWMRHDLWRLVWGCLGLCAFAALWRFVTIYAFDFPPHYNYAATETRLDNLVWGCLLSILMHLDSNGAWRRWLSGYAPVVVAIAVLLLTLLYREEIFRETWRYGLQGMALFVLFLNLFFERNFVFAIAPLEWAPLAWIGKISYGLYLWHMPFTSFLQVDFGLAVGSPLFVVLMVSLSLVFTVASFYIVEKPFNRLRRKFGSHTALR